MTVRLGIGLDLGPADGRLRPLDADPRRTDLRVRGEDGFEGAVRVVGREVVERPGDGADRQPRVADDRREPRPRAGEFAPRRLGLRPEPREFDFELNLIEPGDLLVVQQRLPGPGRVAREADEFVEYGDAPLQRVQVVERPAHRADDGVPLAEQRERRLVHLARGDRLRQRQLPPGDDLLRDLRGGDDAARPLDVAEFVADDGQHRVRVQPGLNVPPPRRVDGERGARQPRVPRDGELDEVVHPHRFRDRGRGRLQVLHANDGGVRGASWCGVRADGGGVERGRCGGAADGSREEHRAGQSAEPAGRREPSRVRHGVVIGTRRTEQHRKAARPGRVPPSQ